jgi:hypothetical protein
MNRVIIILFMLSVMLSASPVPFAIPGDMPPAKTEKLIFIHHSTGGYWLADSEGNEIGSELDKAPKKNNYFTSATNYDWALTVLVV